MDAESAQALSDGMRLIIVHRGQASLAFESGRLDLEESHIVLFWASIPRLLLTQAPALVTSVHLPLDRFLGWRLPEDLSMRLLEGHPSRGLAGDVEGMAALKWEDDLAANDPFVRRAAELEIQACVLRMARKSALLQPMASEQADWRRAAAYILAHLEEDLSVARIAQEMGRHPSHAMRLFKAQTGFTLNEFILQHRLARAKRLLLEGSLSVGEAAMRAGFGSERRFFEAFKAAEGCSPRVYRLARRVA